MTKRRRVDTNKPRQLRGQNAWYYLPMKGESRLEVLTRKEVTEPGFYTFAIAIPARKLLRELIAAGVTP